jgi:pimeloyl-ACP methyl ester carboxylesterase
MGDGAPLVLLTGMTGHAEMWLKNLHSLSRHLDVYAVDMPGHGLTDAPRVKYEIPDFADDVLQFHVARQAPKLIPDSTFELVKNCAHWPRLEKPELFHQIVGDFPAA